MKNVRHVAALVAAAALAVGTIAPSGCGAPPVDEDGPAGRSAPRGGPHLPDRYDVTWDSPSTGPSGSMPLGNGDIGVNAWVEKTGDLLFYISKTDSWGDNGRLLKVGRVRVALSPSPLPSDEPFVQKLSLHDATMDVRFGKGDASTAVQLWVDANHPVIHVTVRSPRPLEATASIELWRKERYTLPSLECSDVLNKSPRREKTVVEPDTVLKDLPGGIGWYHRNVKSVGPALTARIQGAKDFDRPDPLLGRTFGAVVMAKNGMAEKAGWNARRLDDLRLLSPASTTHRISVYVLTKHPASPEEWLAAVDDTLTLAEGTPFARRRKAHERWWRDFWERSWIHVTQGAGGGKRAGAMTRSPVPRNRHPFRVGVDQKGANRYSGEFGRMSVFGRSLPAAEVERLAGIERTQLVKGEKGLLHSAMATSASTIEGLGDRAFDKGLTIETWVRPGRLPASGARLVDKITPGGSDGMLLDTWPGNSLRLIVGKSILHRKNVLPAGRWSHVAAVVDPAGGMALYLDGKRLGEHETAADDAPADDAYVVSRAYALQRFVNACAGRGRYPIKFNGTIFTVPHPGKPGDADYRRWGPGYWWQNTRLPYISMCASGDFDLMEPLFRMYGREIMPLLRYKTRVHTGHGGVYIPECIYFWGDMFSETYGWKPCEERTDKLQASGWHKWEWVSGPELVFMMLDRYEHAPDETFLRETLMPAAHEILTFFDQHYKTDQAGKLVMHPAMACETWWDCTNPMPEVAGLIAVTTRMLSLPRELTTAEQRAFWTAFKRKLPPLPTREVKGERMLAPAARFARKRNCENPELYAVFPFRLIAVGRPDIELGRRALKVRWDRGSFGWRQDDIFMAYLGLAGEARQYLVRRARKKHAGSRFPAFWGPNYDWIPDQDHGSIILKALQAMTLQTDGRKIYVAPAWPDGWNVDFKLHAPYGTTVEGSVRAGKVVDLKVDPVSRRADVVVMGTE
ncbi:MAG: DUF5703 domain-containing protein [Planctomycetota bacterium]|jgi:hypothetical protein